MDFIGQYLAQNDQKCIFWAKIGHFGAKNPNFPGGSKKFGTHLMEKPCRHLVRFVFWWDMGPNGPKRPIFGQKSIFFRGGVKFGTQGNNFPIRTNPEKTSVSKLACGWIMKSWGTLILSQLCHLFEVKQGLTSFRIYIGVVPSRVADFATKSNSKAIFWPVQPGSTNSKNKINALLSYPY